MRVRVRQRQRQHRTCTASGRPLPSPHTSCIHDWPHHSCPCGCHHAGRTTHHHAWGPCSSTQVTGFCAATTTVSPEGAGKARHCACVAAVRHVPGWPARLAATQPAAVSAAKQRSSCECSSQHAPASMRSGPQPGPMPGGPMPGGPIMPPACCCWKSCCPPAEGQHSMLVGVTRRLAAVCCAGARSCDSPCQPPGLPRPPGHCPRLRRPARGDKRRRVRHPAEHSVQLRPGHCRPAVPRKDCADCCCCCC